MAEEYRSHGADTMKARLAAANIRRQIVMDMVARGDTFAEVAESIGVCVPRARQIFYSGMKTGRGYWHVWNHDDQFERGDMKMLLPDVRTWRSDQALAKPSEVGQVSDIADES